MKLVFDLNLRTLRKLADFLGDICLEKDLKVDHLKCMAILGELVRRAKEYGIAEDVLGEV